MMRRFRHPILPMLVVSLASFAAGTWAQRPGGRTFPPDIDPGSRNRLPVVARDTLSDAGRRLYDKNADDMRTGRSLAGFQGPNGIVLYSPRVAEHDLAKNDYLRFDSHIGRRTYEIAVLVTARELDHQFEWAAHEPAALKAGVEQAIVDAIKYRRPIAELQPKDAVVIRLGREVFSRRSAQSDTFAEALKIYGPQDLVDIVSVMGHYSGIALLLNAFDQQLAPGQKALLPVR
ncbi:MAG: carboxymuconolactone decarboxylase family protein [Vicinamibacterales bacterium]